MTEAQTAREPIESDDEPNTEREAREQALAKEDERRLALQNDLAVDENDPRVAPHLDTAASNQAVDAEELRRRDEARVATQARLEQSQAKIEAAREALHEAREQLNAAMKEHETNLNTYSQLEPGITATPAHHLSPGEETTLMFFPKEATVNENGKTATFPAGIHPVPNSLVSHWWFLSNGVRPYKGKLPEPPAEATAAEDDVDDKDLAQDQEEVETDPTLRTRPSGPSSPPGTQPRVRPRAGA